MKCRSRFLLVTLIVFIMVGMVGATTFASSLTIYQNEAPVTMDPSNHTATYTNALLHPMYEKLTKFNEDMEIVPSLAEDWDVDDQGTEWTFYLREGVEFHDGTPFRAEAVKASFDRVLDPDEGLAGYGRFSPVIDEVEIIDDYTVKFKLSDPYPPFLRLLSLGQAAIISPEVLDEDDLGEKAVGTGPYEFVEWVSGEQVRMKRNEDYWGEIPEVEELVWQWTPEDSVRAMLVQTGEADVSLPISPAYVSALETDSEINLYKALSNRVFWVAMNTLHEPFDDVKVRQAMNYAVDREGLIQSVLFGLGEPANSPMGPIAFGYDSDCPQYPHDVEKAKELLEEAGYPDGIEFELAIAEAWVDIAEALEGMWAEANIDADINVMEHGLLNELIFSSPEESEMEANLNNWAGAALDADSSLRPLFHTEEFAPQGANLGFYSNEKVDELLDKAASTVDTEERKEYYSEVQKIIQEEAPHVSTHYQVATAGMRENVEGVWMMGTGMLVVRNPSIAD